MTKGDFIELNLIFTDTLEVFLHYLKEKNKPSFHLFEQYNSSYQDEKFAFYLEGIASQINSKNLLTKPSNNISEDIQIDGPITPNDIRRLHNYLTTKEVFFSHKEILLYLSYINDTIDKYAPKFLKEEAIFYVYKKNYKKRIRTIKTIYYEYRETVVLLEKEKATKNFITLIDLLYPLSIIENYSTLEKPPTSHFGNTRGIIMASDFDEPLDDFLEYM